MKIIDTLGEAWGTITIVRSETPKSKSVGSGVRKGRPKK